jgi:hypothetical protein
LDLNKSNSERAKKAGNGRSLYRTESVRLRIRPE